MEEEALEGENKRWEDAEAGLWVATEDLESAAKEAKQGRDRDRFLGGCGRNGAADLGVAAAASAITTTGTVTTPGALGTMARTEKIEEEGGGAAATATATSEVRTRG